jgi:hypothetical protein
MGGLLWKLIVKYPIAPNSSRESQVQSTITDMNRKGLELTCSTIRVSRGRLPKEKSDIKTGHD